MEMRTNEEIKKDADQFSVGLGDRLIIEVLLDIRDHLDDISENIFEEVKK